MLMADTAVLNATCIEVLEKMPCHPKCAVMDNNNHVLHSHFLRTPPSMYVLQTDVFFILLNHCHIFNCSHLFQHLVCGLVDTASL